MVAACGSGAQPVVAPDSALAEFDILAESGGLPDVTPDGALAEFEMLAESGGLPDVADATPLEASDAILADLPDTAAACEGLQEDPAAAEFDLDCAGTSGCVVRETAVGCACSHCLAGRCLRLADAVACGSRPTVQETAGSVALPDGCTYGGGPMTIKMTAAALLPDRGLLLGGTFRAPGFLAKQDRLL